MVVMVAAAAVALVGSGVLAYCRAARFATGRPDARSLLAAQVGLLFVAVVPFAFSARGWFLAGRLLEGAAAALVPSVVGGVLAGLGTQISWWRHGRPSVAQKQAAIRRWAFAASPRVAWLFLGSMCAATVAVTGQVWFFAWRALLPDVTALLSLAPALCAMGLAALMIPAARVPARQPFWASVVATTLLGVPGLATGFVYGSQLPRQSWLFGWTALCVLLACVFVLVGIYFRVVVLWDQHQDVRRAGRATSPAALSRVLPEPGGDLRHGCHRAHRRGTATSPAAARGGVG